MTGTNATRDPDSVLAAWLDEGPTDLPDATRRAILTALPTTSQARRGPFAAWRFQAMSPLARGAAAVVIAAVALGGVYLFAGRSTPSAGGASPSPSAMPWQRVSSRFFGISYEIPPGWQVTYSAFPWVYGSGTPEGTGMDTVSPGPGHPAGELLVASQLVPSGVDQQTWFATNFAAQSPSWPSPPFDRCGPHGISDFTPTTLAGVPAFEWDGLDTPLDQPVPGTSVFLRCGVAVVVAFDGGRAYRLTYAPTPDPADRALMQRWLSSVQLSPADAIDALPTNPPAGQ